MMAHKSSPCNYPKQPLKRFTIHSNGNLHYLLANLPPKRKMASIYARYGLCILFTRGLPTTYIHIYVMNLMAPKLGPEYG